MWNLKLIFYWRTANRTKIRLPHLFEILLTITTDTQNFSCTYVPPTITSIENFGGDRTKGVYLNWPTPVCGVHIPNVKRVDVSLSLFSWGRLLFVTRHLDIMRLGDGLSAIYCRPIRYVYILTSPSTRKLLPFYQHCFAQLLKKNSELWTSSKDSHYKQP